MKRIIFLCVVIYMSLNSKAQSVKDITMYDTFPTVYTTMVGVFSVKDGIIYDTLTTIENEDFIVSEAIIAYRDEGYGTFGVEICATAIAKKNMNILITKIWSGCRLTDEVKAAKGWGGIKFTNFKKNRRLRFSIGLTGEYVYESNTSRILNMKWNCEENKAKHILRGFVLEYFIGRYRKYLVIDKFKIISKFKLNEYFAYRDEILNKKK